MSSREQIDNQFKVIDGALLKLYFSWKYNFTYEVFDFLTELKHLFFAIKQYDAIELYQKQIDEYFVIFYGVSRYITQMTYKCNYRHELTGNIEDNNFGTKAFNQLRSDFNDGLKDIYGDIKNDKTLFKKWFNDEFHGFHSQIETFPNKFYENFEENVLEKLSKRIEVIKNMRIVEEYLSNYEYDEYVKVYNDFMRLNINGLNDLFSNKEDMVRSIESINRIYMFFDTFKGRIEKIFSQDNMERNKHLNNIDFVILNPLRSKKEDLLNKINQSNNLLKENISGEKKRSKKTLAKLYGLKIYFLYQTNTLKYEHEQRKDDKIKEIASVNNFHWTTFKKYFFKGINPRPKEDILNLYEPEELMADLEIVIQGFEIEGNEKALILAKEKLALLKENSGI